MLLARMSQVIFVGVLSLLKIRKILKIFYLKSRRKLILQEDKLEMRREEY